MIKTADFIEQWMLEREEKGRDEGRDEGRLEEARDLALELLHDWFGPLPEEMAGRVRTKDEAWCKEVIKKARRASSLQDLDLSQKPQTLDYGSVKSLALLMDELAD